MRWGRTRRGQNRYFVSMCLLFCFFLLLYLVLLHRPGVCEGRGGGEMRALYVIYRGGNGIIVFFVSVSRSVGRSVGQSVGQ